MGFEFLGDKLVGDKFVNGERREFDFMEEVEFDCTDNREVNTLQLSCGSPFTDAWRSVVVEFLDINDYEAFCDLLRRAHDIEFS